MNKIVAIFSAIAIMTAGTSSGINVFAAQSTQDQIDATEDEIDDLEDQKRKTQEMLDELKSGSHSVQEQLDLLNNTLAEISYNLEDINDRILLKEADISEAETILERAEAASAEQYEDMVARVRLMYERNDATLLNAILSAGSLAEVLNIADYYESIQRYDKEKLAEYKAVAEAIADEKERLEGEKELLEQLKVDAEEESAKVSEAIEETQKTIELYADQIAEAEALADQYEKELEEKEKDLEYLKQKLEEEKRKSREASEGQWRDISEITFEEGDRYLLANLIYCEAGGEPYEGQVAVGAVVINRMLSGVFPDTLSGVIYAPNQFSPAGSGRLAIALAQNKATESCYKAADEAMSGITNVGNCVYFRTPIEGLSGIQIGGHIFY